MLHTISQKSKMKRVPDQVLGAVWWPKQALQHLWHPPPTKNVSKDLDYPGPVAPKRVKNSQKQHSTDMLKNKKSLHFY